MAFSIQETMFGADNSLLGNSELLYRTKNVQGTLVKIIHNEERYNLLQSVV